MNDIENDLKALHQENRPNPMFAHKLEMQLRMLHQKQKGEKIMRSTPLFRNLSLTAAATLMLVLLVLVIPPLNAFAQDILRQIGNLSLTNSPTFTERELNSDNSQDATSDTPLVLLTLEEASNQAGFAVLIPDYVPTDFTLVYRVVEESDSAKMVMTTYQPARNPKEDQSIWVYQGIVPDNQEYPVGDAAVVDVTVRGLPGVWVENVVTGVEYSAAADHTNGQSTLLRSNFLFWEENGFLFAIQSPVLGLDETLKVAESLN